MPSSLLGAGYTHIEHKISCFKRSTGYRKCMKRTLILDLVERALGKAS